MQRRPFTAGRLDAGRFFHVDFAGHFCRCPASCVRILCMALCKAAAQEIDHGDKKDETRLLRQAGYVRRSTDFGADPFVFGICRSAQFFYRAPRLSSWHQSHYARGGLSYLYRGADRSKYCPVDNYHLGRTRSDGGVERVLFRWLAPRSGRAAQPNIPKVAWLYRPPAAAVPRLRVCGDIDWVFFGAA